jgi:hypothetical protein
MPVEVPAPASMLTFEELHCAFVLLRRRSATKGSKIATTVRPGINLP